MVKWRVCAWLHLNDDCADQGYSFGAVNRINNWNQVFFLSHSDGKWNVNIQSNNVWNVGFALKLRISICILRNLQTSSFWGWNVCYMNSYKCGVLDKTSGAWPSCKEHSTGRSFPKFVGDCEKVPLCFYGQFDTFYIKLTDCKNVRILYKFYRFEFFF